MAYDSGSNTWPSTATAVGKTYGPRDVGGSDGVTKTEGIFNEVVFQVTADTDDLTYSANILGDYLVEDITLNVKTAFDASSTADISIDGGAGLTTDLDLATAGVSSVATTGLGNLTGTGPLQVVLTPDSTATGSDDGEATVVIRYRRIV